MLRNSHMLKITDFSGGINVNDPEDEIQDNQAWFGLTDYDATRNVYWEDGKLKKRAGTTNLNKSEISGADEIVNGLRVYRESAPTKTTIVAANVGTDAVRVYYLDGSNIFQEITNGTGWGGFTVNSDVYFAVWKGNVYLTNGDTVIQKITYSGGWDMNDISGNTNHPQYIVQHKDRLWVAGGNMNEGQVECSAYEYDNSWSGADGEIFNFGYKDGDPITGLVSYFDNLIVFKHNSIWFLSGDNAQNWFEKKNQKSVGCVAPKSIVSTPYGILFYGSDNQIYLFNMESLIPVSYNIQPVLDLVPTSMRDKAAGIYYDHYYRLATAKSGSGYNDIELLLDTYQLSQQKTTWWFNDGRNINAYIKYDGQGDNNTLYYCDSNAGYMRAIDSGITDYSNSITMEYQTKYFNFGSVHLQKSYDRFLVNVTEGVGDYNISFIKNVDDEYIKEYTISSGSGSGVYADTGGALWDDAVWQGESITRYTWPDKSWLVPDELDGNSLSIKIKHDTDSEDVAINSMTIFYATKRIQ